jgi:uncharacterized protein YkwD
MEGSENRIHKLIRTAVPTALLVAGVLAVAGCGGGGGSSNSAKPPAPVNQSASNGGAVTAEGTEGLVGPAGRATSKSQQFDDKTGEIPATANRKPKKAGGVAAGANCPDIGITPSDSNADQVNAAILCLVNGERTDAGNLPPLQTNAQLQQAAAGMCQRMVTEHFFAHETPDGKNVVDRVEPTGYIPDSGDWVVGENLAWGSGALSTPQAIVNGWMNSPGHKANILATDYKDVGLAACQGSPSTQVSGGTVYVNDFGAKTGADLNAKLPSEDGSDSGSSGNSGSNATAASASAGGAAGATAAAKAKARAKAKAKAKKKARRHRRHKRH